MNTKQLIQELTAECSDLQARKDQLVALLHRGEICEKTFHCQYDQISRRLRETLNHLSATEKESN